jgi:hypothetical protein
MRERPIHSSLSVELNTELSCLHYIYLCNHWRLVVSGKSVNIRYRVSPASIQFLDLFPVGGLQRGKHANVARLEFMQGM